MKEIIEQKLGKDMKLKIPKEFTEFINVKEGDIICIMNDEGKYGRYVAFWNKKDTAEK